MKYWLILYMMTFSPDGQLVDGHWLEQPHATAGACSSALDKIMEDWKKRMTDRSRTGIVGRCSDRPLGSLGT